MKCLFVSVNKDKGFRPALPIGMITVATEATKYGHEVYCVDLCFENDLSAVENALRDFDPGILAISIRNIDLQSYLEPVFSLPLTRRIAELCHKTKPSCKIVLGGPAFTLMPEEMMRYIPADFGIVGPGEINLPVLLDNLDKNESINNIPGLISRNQDGSLLVNPTNDAYVEFGSEPTANRKLYDERYFSYSFTGPTTIKEAADAVLSKRGCPLSCIYCTNSIIAGTKLKLKSPEKTVDEIEELTKLGKTKRFEFADGAFNMPYDHALQICKEMVKRNMRFPWNCMFSPGAANPELLDLMVASGCDLLELGSEAGSDKILRILQKNFNVERLKKVHEMIDERGIKAEHCIFIGSPGETKETILETLDTMEELVPDTKDSLHRLYVTFGYRIFKGTKLYQIALDEGIINEKDYLAVPKYYIAPNILKDDSLLDLIEEKIAGHSNWYLWWGIPNIHLKERVKEMRKIYQRMDEVFLKAIGIGSN